MLHEPKRPVRAYDPEPWEGETEYHQYRTFVVFARQLLPTADFDRLWYGAQLRASPVSPVSPVHPSHGSSQ